jgi:drug/metabolite transporter (DMT)-like permease
MKTLRSYLPILAGLFSSVIFGFGYYSIKICLSYLNNDPIKLLSSRFILAATVMTLMVVFGFQNVSYRGKPLWLVLIGCLFGQMIGNLCENTASMYMPISQISMLTSLLPIAVLVFSALINREYPQIKELLFFAVSIIGVLTVRLAGLNTGGTTTIGFVLMLISVISIAIQRTINRRASAHFTPFELTYTMMIFGSLFFTAFSLVKSGVSGTLSTYLDAYRQPGLWPALLYNAVGMAVFGFFFLNYAIANLPVALSQSISNFSILVGVFAGVALSGDRMGTGDIIGVILIIVGAFGLSLTYHPDNTMRNRYQARPIIKADASLPVSRAKP